MKTVFTFTSLALVGLLAVASPAHAQKTADIVDTAVAAGSFTPPQPAGGTPAAPFSDLPAFCRVVASTRVLNSDVTFEVWMPAQGWTGEFVPAGSSFWGGPIPFARMREVLRTGAVTVGTNLGIEGFNGPSFVIDHPEKLENLKMEPLHVVVDRARTLMATFYGSEYYAEAKEMARRLQEVKPGDKESAEVLAKLQTYPADPFARDR